MIMWQDTSSFLSSFFLDGPISTILLGVLFFSLLFYIMANKKPANYPPGPLGLPLLGNLLQLGSTPHISLAELARVYGPVFSLRLGSQDVVVLSTGEVVKEAFGKKSLQFAGRPRVYSFDMNSNEGRSILFSDYGPRQVLHKKCAVQALQVLFKDPTRLQNLILKELGKIKAFLVWNEGSPLTSPNFLRKAVLALSFSLTFGDLKKDHDTLQDELYDILEKARDFNENSPSSALLDFMPWLRFALRKEANILESSVDDLLGFVKKVYKLSKEKKKKKEENERNERDKDKNWSFAAELEKIVSDINERQSKHYKANVELLTSPDKIPPFPAQRPKTAVKEALLKIDEEDTITILTDIFASGFETVANSLGWAVGFLLRNPKIQEDLQNEIDKVVGENNMPSINDKTNLPLLEAAVLETLRLSTVVPLALPHCTTEQTSVADYSLPKGTMVLANLWNVNRDSRYFHQPDQFNPYRFIDDETGSIKPDLLQHVMAFSAGPRRCLGYSLAKAEMFLLLGGILKMFKMEPTQQGLPNLQGKFGVILMSDPFKVKLTLRKDSSEGI